MVTKKDLKMDLTKQRVIPMENILNELGLASTETDADKASRTVTLQS